MCAKMYEQELATATSIPDVLEDFLQLFHLLLIKVGDGTFGNTFRHRYVFLLAHRAAM